LKDAFFHEGRDISTRQVQEEIAKQMQLPVQRIHDVLDSGQAFAAMHLDDVAKQNYKVPGSPTLMLYGNVGYRIIDANVRELLHNPEQGEASWC